MSLERPSQGEFHFSGEIPSHSELIRELSVGAQVLRGEETVEIDEKGGGAGGFQVRFSNGEHVFFSYDAEVVVPD